MEIIIYNRVVELRDSKGHKVFKGCSVYRNLSELKDAIEKAASFTNGNYSQIDKTT